MSSVIGVAGRGLSHGLFGAVWGACAQGAFLPLSYRTGKTREGHAGEGCGRGPGEEVVKPPLALAEGWREEMG